MTLKHPVEALANSFDYDSRKVVLSAALDVASNRSFRSLLRFEEAIRHPRVAFVFSSCNILRDYNNSLESWLRGRALLRFRFLRIA